MIPSAHRPSRHDVVSVMRQGRQIRGETGFLRYQPADMPRVGVIVSRKVAKLATQRNRIRRQIKAILKELILTREANSASLTVIFYVTQRTDYQNYYQDLHNITKRLPLQ